MHAVLAADTGCIEAGRPFRHNYRRFNRLAPQLLSDAAILEFYGVDACRLKRQSNDRLVRKRVQVHSIALLRNRVDPPATPGLPMQLDVAQEDRCRLSLTHSKRQSWRIGS